MWLWQRVVFLVLDNEHMLNKLKMFFTLMSIAGKKESFRKPNNGQKCLFSAKMYLKFFYFKENHVKLEKALGVFIQFPVILFKLLIVNWDVLIPFILFSFFCLKSKNLLFSTYFFVLCWGAPSKKQKCGAWDRGSSDLRPPPL